MTVIFLQRLKQKKHDIFNNTELAEEKVIFTKMINQINEAVNKAVLMYGVKITVSFKLNDAIK